MRMASGPTDVNNSLPTLNTFTSGDKAFTHVSATSSLGPLGNGWSLDAKASRVLLVGGGVGIPPLYHWAKAQVLSAKKKAPLIEAFIGGRDKSLLHCEAAFKKLKIHVHVSTDNGSKGHHGLITEILKKSLQSNGTTQTQVFTCGPTPMLRAVSAITERHAIPCQVSVEESMPCGYGVCLGCAIKVKANGHPAAAPGQKVRFAMSCTEGPVFDAQSIVWN